MKRLLATAAIVAGVLSFGSAAGHATSITTSSDLLVNFTGTGGSPSLTGTATAELGDFVFGAHSVTSSSKSRSSVFFRADHRYPHELIV